MIVIALSLINFVSDNLRRFFPSLHGKDILEPRNKSHPYKVSKEPEKVYWNESCLIVIDFDFGYEMCPKLLLFTFNIYMFKPSCKIICNYSENYNYTNFLYLK